MGYLSVVKHDGTKQDFNPDKIFRAVIKAGRSVGDNDSNSLARVVADDVWRYFCHGKPDEISVDSIHDKVEKELMRLAPDAAKSYILYRQKRTEYRESQSGLSKDIARFYTTINKDNANAANGSAASKMYSVAEAATKRYNLSHMSESHANNHKNGRIYIHDLGYYGVTFNCFFNPLGKMLEKGFSNGVGSIRPPKRIGSATALACIILQSSQNSMFGGQGFLNFDTDLAPYVEKEYKWQKERIEEDMRSATGDYINSERVKKLALKRTNNAVYQAMEQFVYNCNMMRSRSGAQVTFSSVNFGTDTSKNLFKAYIAGLGKGENPIFPNLCYRVKDGVNLHKGEPNFDITELAIECVGKRIQPRFVFCDSKAYDGMPLKYIGTMGCRTAVRSNVNGEQNPDARGNLAFVTINLPMLALEAENTDGDIKKNFKKVLNEAIDDSIDELNERYKVLCSLKKRDIPFVSDWYMGHENIKSENDSIEPMIKNGSLSIGFVGLAECLVVLTGKHHGESDKAQKLGLKIVGRIREKADNAKEKYHLNFSCFATPAESACYTLLKKTRDRFGVIEGVTDKEYFTNSCHIPVSYECDAKHKIDIEAPYHLLCNAGAIFYVEAGNTTKFNPDGVLALIQYMDKSGIVYGGINWEHDYCVDCGYQGTFDGTCPKCGSKNVKVTKIITGYLSESWRFNKGKQAEAADRVSHTGGAL